MAESYREKLVFETLRIYLPKKKQYLKRRNWVTRIFFKETDVTDVTVNEIFKETMYYCAQDTETTTPLLLHCPSHHCANKSLFHKINEVNRLKRK